MIRCHAFRLLTLVIALSAPTALAPVAADTPTRLSARTIPSGPGALDPSFAAKPHNDQWSSPDGAAHAQLLAPLLVLFIPWADPKPTPQQPGNGGDPGGGTTNSGNPGGDPGTGGDSGGGDPGTGGQTGGGNPGGSGGTTDPGGSGSKGPPTGSGNTGDPGGSPQPNPEPATMISGLLGAGLLALASLRRRRWARV